MELQRYRTIEAAHEKWEAREQRLADDLDKMREELIDYKDKTGSVESTAVSEQMAAAERELQEAREEVKGLKRDKEELQLERDELKAELALMQTRVLRLEGMGSVEDRCGGLWEAPLSARRESGSHSTSKRATGMTRPLDAHALTFRSEAPTHSRSLTASSSTDPLAPVVTSFPGESDTRWAPRTPATLTLTDPTRPTMMTTTRPTLLDSHLPAPTPGRVPAVSPAMATLTAPTSEGAPHTVLGLPHVHGAMPYPPSATLLPQIPNFYGDQKDGETFQDWVEQFEAVGSLAGWNDHFKLVYLTSALKGAAKSFFRSCLPTQRSKYDEMVAALKKRFTQVQLTAVQTQLFHSCRQGQKESVDDFAQELRKLHTRAYAAATCVNAEAEKVGQIVLVNQFVSGLRPELQAKIVGIEGSMDELILKARFEEAKTKEFAATRTSVPFARRPPASHGDAVTSSTPSPTRTSWKAKPNIPAEERCGPDPAKSGRRGNRKCFNCGLKGHLARACTYRKPARADQEAHG